MTRVKPTVDKRRKLDLPLVDEPPCVNLVNPDVVEGYMLGQIFSWPKGPLRGWAWGDSWKRFRVSMRDIKTDDGTNGRNFLYDCFFMRAAGKALGPAVKSLILDKNAVPDDQICLDKRTKKVADIDPMLSITQGYQKWCEHKVSVDFVSSGRDIDLSEGGKRGTKCSVEMSLLIHPDAVSDPANAFKAMIRGNLAPPMIFVRNDDLMEKNLDPAEQRARGLLRDMIGDEAYHQYLRRGFMTVKGRSGAVYKIKGGVSLVEMIDDKGAIIKSFCVQLSQKGLPYTDALIMRMLLIRYDEMALAAIAEGQYGIPVHLKDAPWLAA